ncbi:MAG: hypothetical protein V7637_4266 [Mycobacteriales bacterium]|jgi:hypothetical protein
MPWTYAGMVINGVGFAGLIANVFVHSRGLWWAWLALVAVGLALRLRGRARGESALLRDWQRRYVEEVSRARRLRAGGRDGDEVGGRGEAGAGVGGVDGGPQR